MVRTFAAALLAPALLWAIGCSSQSASNAPEGENSAATASGEAGQSSAGSDVDSAATPGVSSAATSGKTLTAEEHVARGVKLSAAGKRRDAIAAYTAALKQDSKHLPALLYRAGEEYALQDFAPAEKDIAQALALDSKFAEAYILRAHLWGVKHDYQRAVDDFLTALKHPERDAHFVAYFGDKKDVVAHVYLAATYSECPDLAFRDDAKAFEHAMQACQIDNWQNRRYVSLLLNAIAGAKTQEEALRRQEEAIAAAPSTNIKDVLQTAVEAFDMRSEFPLR
jgi:tetratricopeptide (TPR) repeat protein